MADRRWGDGGENTKLTQTLFSNYPLLKVISLAKTALPSFFQFEASGSVSTSLERLQMASVMSAVSFTRSLVKGMSCRAFASQRQCYDKPCTSIISGAKSKLWSVRVCRVCRVCGVSRVSRVCRMVSPDFVLGKRNLVYFCHLGTLS